jgi:hypothetical protein
MITEDDFSEWKELKVTRAFLKAISDQAKMRRAMLSDGVYEYKEKRFSEIGEEVYRLLTLAEIYENILEIPLEDIQEYDIEVQASRVPSQGTT